MCLLKKYFKNIVINSSSLDKLVSKCRYAQKIYVLNILKCNKVIVLIAKHKKFKFKFLFDNFHNILFKCKKLTL